MLTIRLVSFALIVIGSAALAKAFGPAPAVTDGLVFEKDFPKAIVVGAAGQIAYNGMVDTAKYKDGLILDEKVRIRVFTYDPVTGKAVPPPLYDKTEVEVTGLTKWAGTTKRVGGFPKGLYAVQVEVASFKQDGNTAARPAILIKQPFEIK